MPNNLLFVLAPAMLRCVISETSIPHNFARSVFDPLHRVLSGPFCHSPPRPVGPAPSLFTSSLSGFLLRGAIFFFPIFNNLSWIRG